MMKPVGVGDAAEPMQKAMKRKKVIKYGQSLPISGLAVMGVKIMGETP